jgi:hypothetical protein
LVAVPQLRQFAGPYGPQTIEERIFGGIGIAFLNPGVEIMSLGTILLIILILILLGVIPTWPHSSGWGYYPAGGVGLILVIVLILLLLGRL